MKQQALPQTPLSRFSHFTLYLFFSLPFFGGGGFVSCFPAVQPKLVQPCAGKHNAMNCFSFLHVFPPSVFSFNCELFKRLGFLNCRWQKTTLCLCWPVTVIYWTLNGVGPSPGWDQNPSHTGAQKNNLLSKHICIQKAYWALANDKKTTTIYQIITGNKKN